MKTTQLKQKFLKLAVIGVLAMGASSAANAIASVSQFFYFNANCSDCAVTANAQAYGVVGTLELGSSYVQGTPITEAEFLSFTYSGSNLVNPYSVLKDNQNTNAHQFGFIDGLIDLSGFLPAKGVLDLLFGDGLRFQNVGNGDWYTCAPAFPDGSPYYAGTCDYLNNSDLGTGVWSLTAGPTGPTGGQEVPEPASMALLGLGLAALSLSLRKRMH